MSLRLLAAVGALAYVATLLIVPLLNPSEDVLRLHPEDYAGATAGFLVPLGYVLLAFAAAVAASVAWRMGGLAARVASACLVVAAVICIANAVDPTLGQRRSPIEIGVLGFLLGPLALAARRRDLPTRVLAVAVAMGFVALFAAPIAVGGLVNRLLDALIGVWCAIFLASGRGRAG